AMSKADLSRIKAADSADSLKIIKSVLDNQAGPAKDIVSLNAGAAIYVCGLASSLAEGVEKAQSVIADGRARAKFEALIEHSNQF
ncbi:Anthranilate phosphoribosyltransferase, partial [hydrothermal vent metagenome]